MACGCGKAKRGTQAFTLTTDDGKTSTYSTRLEAEAAKARAGSGQIKTKA